MIIFLTAHINLFASKNNRLAFLLGFRVAIANWGFRRCTLNHNGTIGRFLVHVHIKRTFIVKVLWGEKKLIKNFLCRKWQYFMSRIATISSIIKTHLNSLPRRFVVIINSCMFRDEMNINDNVFSMLRKLLLLFIWRAHILIYARQAGERIIAYTLLCISTNLWSCNLIFNHLLPIDVFTYTSVYKAT